MDSATTDSAEDSAIDRDSRGARSARSNTGRILRRATIVRVAILGVVLVSAAALAYAAGWLSVERVVAWLGGLRSQSSPVLEAAVFLVVFAGFVAIGFPATPFLIAGGFVFGAIRGTFLNLLGGALAVSAGYWLSRTVARDAATHLLGARGKDLLARSTRFGSILRLRLVPVIPMSAISYAAGIARVSFPSFLLASVIGTMASSWGYAYLADSIVSGAIGTTAVFRKIALPIAILLVLSIVPRVFARASAPRDAVD